MDAALGERDDFAAFYRANRNRVVAALRSLAGEATEDVVQDAFVALYERWHEVRGYDAPVAWVRLVATRIALRRGFRESRRAELEPALEPATPAAPRDPDLWAALGDLPSGQAAAIALHHLDDRPVKDVARALGCSVPAAKVWLHRGRGRLAERVGGYRGRWVCEATWSVEAIASHLRASGSGRHIDVVIDELAGRGGRWELVVADGRYVLERDDGLRLDEGRISIGRDELVLHPGPSPGRVVLAASMDAERMKLSPRVNSTPSTRGVPDDVWMGLFLGASPMVWAGRPNASV